MDAVIGKLKERVIALKAEKERLAKDIQQVERTLAALEIVIADCSASPGEGGGHVPMSELQEALMEIAIANRGIFNTYDHKALLIERGLLRGDSQATAGRLYDALSRSPRFEKNGERGRWRLLPEGR